MAVSRYAALAVFVLALGDAVMAGHVPWTVAVLGVVSLALIAFPREIDGATFGHWYRGQRIDVHTPAVLIAGMGWVGLAVCALTAVDPAWMDRLFGWP